MDHNITVFTKFKKHIKFICDINNLLNNTKHKPNSYF